MGRAIRAALLLCRPRPQLAGRQGCEIHPDRSFGGSEHQRSRLMGGSAYLSPRWCTGNCRFADGNIYGNGNRHQWNCGAHTDAHRHRDNRSCSDSDFHSHAHEHNCCAVRNAYTDNHDCALIAHAIADTHAGLNDRSSGSKHWLLSCSVLCDPGPGPCGPGPFSHP
jgi:hypothetical protein